MSVCGGAVVDPWELWLGPTLGPRRPPLRGGSHHGTPQTTAQGRPPPTRGPRKPQLRDGPHPVLSELRQLRVLSRNV